MSDGRPLRLASLALALAVAAGLSWVAADDLPRSSGVAPLVERNLEESGVSSPVTAVLLNFRAHDTLLEIAVLLAAAVAVFLLAPIDHPSPVATEPLTRGPPPTPMLRFFTPRLAPVAAVMAGYLWWAGSSLPGGAFQGGAVLAGAGVLLMLGGLRPPRGAYPGLRAAMAGGLLLFLLAAAAPLALGNAFLEYPEGWAKATIVGIEAALTVSIAFGLAELVIGVPPRDD